MAIAMSGACRSNSIPSTTYAALDLGTNNCRLLIARPTSDGFRVIDAFSRIIRLGEGVAASRRISEAAVGRAVEALQVCRDKMHARGVMRARLIATAACRAAENGEEFRSRVAREAGLELEIIDSATEARLAATGCTELFDPSASGVILFDIGGGSSELVRLNRRPGHHRRGPPTPDIVGWASLPVGVVTLAERYGGEVVSRETYDAMVEEVASFVERIRSRPPRPQRLPHTRHVGHGDDHRRRLSAAAALRSPARRRLLAVRRRNFARGRRTDGDEL